MGDGQMSRVEVGNHVLIVPYNMKRSGKHIIEKIASRRRIVSVETVI